MRVYRRGKSPYYYMSLKMPDGTVSRVSTKRRLKAEAEAVALAEQKRLHDMAQLGVKDRITLRELHDIKSQWAESRPAGTRSWVSTAGKALLASLGDDTYIDEVTTRDVTQLVLRASKEGYANGTLNLWMACISSWRATADDLGYRVSELKLKRLKAREKLRYLRPGEEEKVAAHIDKSWWDWLLFIMVLDTGARLQEALSLTWNDVDTVNWEWLILRQTKTNSTVQHKPTDRLRTLLEDYWAKADSRYVFPSKFDSRKHRPSQSCYRLVEAFRLAGLNDDEALVEADGKFTIHSLRDTYATRLVQKGVSLYAVQTMLGHRNSQQTQKYAHLAPSSLADEVTTVLNSVHINGTLGIDKSKTNCTKVA